MTKEKRKEIEKTLRDYRFIDVKIKNIDIDIKRMENDVSLGGGDIFAEKSSPTNAFNSNVENEVIKREERELDQQISNLKNIQSYLIDKKSLIDQSLNMLEDLQREIVKLYYMGRNKVTWLNVAINLGYDETYCKKIRNKALDQLSVLI